MARLLWLPDVLRGAGLEISVERGWETRGAATITPRCIVNHHTASASGGGDVPSLGICINGRPDLAGPLCNLLIARSGRIHVIASGRSNNAHRRGDPAAPQFGATGNEHTIGIEIENNGVGEPWHERVYGSAARANAAICRHQGWGANRCLAHKEWAPARKIDPSFDMGAFRQRVASLLDQEDELSAQAEKEIHDIWQALIGQMPREGGGIHNLAFPILSTNHGVHLLLAAANKGVDPVAIAHAMIAELGEDLAADIVAAVGLALSQRATG